MCKYKNERYEMVKNMKNVMMGTYIRGDKLIGFNFGTDLSIADKQKFVNSIVGLLVDDKHYNSVIRDLITDYFTIEFFTDVDTAELKESTAFLNDTEKFLEETNIVDIVKANASPTLFDELNKAIDNSIAYLTGIHINPLGEALASLINTLEKKVNEFDITDMAEMAQKFAGMTGEFTVDKVVDAYINSDMHKKNLEDINESKVEKAEFAEVLDKAIKTVNEENKTGI